MIRICFKIVDFPDSPAPVMEWIRKAPPTKPVQTNLAAGSSLASPAVFYLYESSFRFPYSSSSPHSSSGWERSRRVWQNTYWRPFGVAAWGSYLYKSNVVGFGTGLWLHRCLLDLIELRGDVEKKHDVQVFSLRHDGTIVQLEARSVWWGR